MCDLSTKGFRTYGLLAAACLMASSCYVTKQGWHQAQLLLASEPVENVLAGDDLSIDQRQKLMFTRAVLEAAREEQLSVGDSYQDYVQTGQPVASWLVFAAYPDRLESRKWWFPIVGSVPYIGYFDSEERDQFAAELEMEGFDVHRGAASAFSSLGWIDDPIFSSMLSRKKWALAQLLFHEVVHRTVWIPGDVRFNENLASYVALHLTNKWLEKWGMKTELQDYSLHQADRRRYKVWARGLRDDLAAFYQSSDRLNLTEKSKIFDRWVHHKKPEFERYDFIGKKPWNNATVQAVALYEAQDDKFRGAHICFGLERPIKDFLQELLVSYERSETSVEALSSLCHH